MDLEAEKQAVLAKLEQNKLDRAKHQEQIEGLDRGTIYLRGQLDFLVAKLKEAEAKLATEVKTETLKLAEEVKSEVESLESNADSDAPVIA